MENAPNRLRAIITGASSGIGKATTLAFASSGIDLCLVSRDQAKLQQVADLASEYGGRSK